jgi:hypothetical protein
MMFNFLPYEYRPYQIYFRFKIWLLKPEKVVPRTIQGYHDKGEKTVHCVMELLCQFIEEECGGSPSGTNFVEWYENGPTYIWNGNKWYVRDIYQYVYDWFNKVYLVKYEQECKKLSELRENHCTIDCSESAPYFMTYEWDSEENREKAYVLMTRYSNKAKRLEDEFENMCCLIIKLRAYMWT